MTVTKGEFTMDIQKVIADAQAKADANGDGRIGFEDLQSGVGQLGDMVAGLKDKLFGGK